MRPIQADTSGFAVVSLSTSGQSHSANGALLRALPWDNLLEIPERRNEQYSPQKLDFRASIDFCGKAIMRCRIGRSKGFLESMRRY
jgi:hypothetical protein